MKNRAKTFVAVLALLTLVPAYGQGRGGMGMGGAPRGPELSGAMAKLFGNNPTFTANMEVQVSGSPGGQNISMLNKMAFDNGNSRVELDMAQLKGPQMNPSMASHMKSMGMEKIVTITLKDKNAKYLIYPGLKGYVEMPNRDPEVSKPESDFKVEMTELGKETVEGHPCVKNKVTVTDKEGKKYESMVWNATDMKNFPVKIETTDQGHTSTILFKDVTFSKSDAALFQPPADFKKYDDQTSLMMEAMKGMQHGMGGMPGGQ
jgi:hypothetical protein